VIERPSKINLSQTALRAARGHADGAAECPFAFCWPGALRPFHPPAAALSDSATFPVARDVRRALTEDLAAARGVTAARVTAAGVTAAGVTAAGVTAAQGTAARVTAARVTAARVTAARADWPGRGPGGRDGEVASIFEPSGPGCDD